MTDPERPRARTLYVRERDQATWEHAAKVARERGRSLSTLVAEALRAYLPAPDPQV